MLFYPKHYHHETQNIDLPTMTVTGTVANPFNYIDLGGRLWEECAGGFDNGFKFSGPLCDAMDTCLRLWHVRWSGKTKKRAKKEVREKRETERNRERETHRKRAG